MIFSEWMKTKQIKTPEEIKEIIQAASSEGVDCETTRQALLHSEVLFITKNIDMSKLFDRALDSFYYLTPETDCQYDIYIGEIKFIHSVPDKTLQKFLMSLLLEAKKNFHETGWIRYRREDIFRRAGLGKCSESLKQTIVQKSREYGVDLRVIGSKNPISCFHIDFLGQENDIVFKSLTTQQFEAFVRCGIW